jgi:hypothetical protein
MTNPGTTQPFEPTAMKALHEEAVQALKYSAAFSFDGGTMHLHLTGFGSENGAGYFVFTIMAGFAEMERKLILERTMHGLAKARERGTIGGATALHSHEDILAAAEEYGVNQAGPKLVPRMSKSGFLKALARARAWKHEQEMLKDAD